MPPVRRRRRPAPPRPLDARHDAQVTQLYNEADAASGERRRELYRVAARLRAAIMGKCADLAELRDEARRALGVLL